MSQELKFKTTINCNNCVAKVKPLLEKVNGIDSWNVDTDNSDKILTVNSSGATAQQIIDAVEQVGFDIEKV
ncbi:copper chaperone [Dysgonomonas alginatilytica]|uniref:Copper chaperone n=1 Tax=Dysgonomonas alginatilytica TaxID=1605892 RepID=A0A2V3PWU2_9BACT|nr:MULTISPECIES: heavy-metal-associated domain-containing protein [Dysgonomonas]MBD8346362.1 heavy-metal-associated domain-containing protein [Dysgonomonas sp. HGC4]MBF0574721.1 heavy-metal-associated domain-containing protein [Dysgonomonas sp. GY617]PXV69058.1 copper chaperone [Dysgonomonas alginatilytica]